MKTSMTALALLGLMFFGLIACDEHTINAKLKEDLDRKLERSQVEYQVYIGMDVVYPHQQIGTEYTMTFTGRLRVYGIYLRPMGSSEPPKVQQYERTLSAREYANVLAMFAQTDFAAYPGEVPLNGEGKPGRWPADTYNISMRVSPDDELKQVRNYTGKSGDYPAGFETLRNELYTYLQELVN